MNTDLIKQYSAMHNQKRGYGRTGESMADIISSIITRHPSWPCQTVLDYGCGKSRLVDMIAPGYELERYQFDPALSSVDHPWPGYCVDWVISTDVLEHVPENKVDRLLNSLSGFGCGLIAAISLRASGNNLPDGTACHLTVKPADWWIRKLKKNYSEVVVKKEYPGPKKILVVCT